MTTLPNLDIVTGNSSFTMRAPGYTDARVLAANTAETVTIPVDSGNSKGANFVFFAANGDFYVNWTTTAAIPGSDVTDGTAAELNPVGRYISGKSSFSIIAPNNTIVTMNFFL